MPEMICPKCQSPMRSYERNSVTVDQCTGCRGVFLDRGELERLVDAESAYYERFPAGRERHHDHDDDDDDDRYEKRRHERGGLAELGGLGGLLGGGHQGHSGGHGGHGHRKKHKRESFLSELFE